MYIFIYMYTYIHICIYIYIYIYTYTVSEARHIRVCSLPVFADGPPAVNSVKFSQPSDLARPVGGGEGGGRGGGEGGEGVVCDQCRGHAVGVCA